MGLGGSKVDPYVLKIEEGRIGGNVSMKPLPQVNRASSKAVLVAQTSRLTDVPSVDKELKEGYNYGLPQKLSSQKSMGVLNKQNSQLNAEGKSPNSSSSKPHRRKSEQDIPTMDVIANGGMTKAQSMVRMSERGGGRFSEKLPWLIKQANFGNLVLADIEFGRVIGRGLMGTVRICKTKQGDKFFVMKSIKKDYISKHNDYRHVQNERDVLMALNSPFCVKLFGTYQDRSNVYFALEYAPGGELFHRLGKKKSFPPQVAKFYATEICCALEYIQSRGFVYRDLKPENIILDEYGHCKIVDFGFSIPCQGDERMRTLCGTPAYLSPEQLDGKLTNGYTRVVDWWSFGVLVYELLTGKTPFCKSHKESHYEIFLRILNSKISFPLSFDGRSKELISSLCHPQLEKRLCEGTEVKKHPYFEIPWDAVGEQRLVPPFVPRLKEEGDDHYFGRYNDPGPPKDDGELVRHEFLNF